MLAALSLAWTAFPVGADLASNTPFEVAYGAVYTATVWTGSKSLTFGGLTNGAGHDEAFSFDPATGDVVLLGAKLPRKLNAMSAVWTGSKAYLFAGDEHGEQEPHDDANRAIIEYDPSRPDATAFQVVATFLTGRAYTSAVWDGTHAWIFGGSSRGAGPPGLFRAEVVRFTPGDPPQVTPFREGNALLARGLTSAVWDGEHAYVFGGQGCGLDQLNACDEVVRYTPATDAVEDFADLPAAQSGTAALWDGGDGYIFGTAAEGGVDEILRFRAAVDRPLRVTEMWGVLPEEREFTNAFWDGTHGYVLTGRKNGAYLDPIVKYSLVPGPPQNLLAAPDPDPVQTYVVLDWQAPPANSFSQPLLGYSIYRAAPPGAFGLLAQPGLVLHYEDHAVQRGVTYCYYVRATNVHGEGVPSNTMCVTAI